MKYFLSYLLIMVFSLFSVDHALAASIYFDLDQKTISLNQDVFFTIYVDTESESINTISGTIELPNTLVSDTFDIYEMDSVIPFWLQKPNDHIRHFENHTEIDFAGIIPGGVNQNNLELFTIKTSVKDIIQEQISFKDVQMLKNDGRGGEVFVSHKPIKIRSTLANITTEPAIVFIDKTPPQSFTPIVSSNKDLFDGNPFLVFSTVDKESGLDYFEVKEEGLRFEKVQSPYKIKQVDKKQIIQVKAIDKFGNERIEHVEVEIDSIFFIWSIILGLISICLILLFAIIHNKNKKIQLE